MGHKISWFILRVSLGVVFLIFGIGKLQHDYWARTIETMDIFQRLPWDVSISVLLIGYTEIITGAMLIIGLFTRVFAALAAFQLLGILFLVNFQEARDIALLGEALYLAINEDIGIGINCLLKKNSSKAA